MILNGLVFFFKGKKNLFTAFFFFFESVASLGSQPGSTKGPVGTTRKGMRAETDKVSTTAKDNMLSSYGLGLSCVGSRSPTFSPALNTVNK